MFRLDLWPVTKIHDGCQASIFYFLKSVARSPRCNGIIPTQHVNFPIYIYTHLGKKRSKSIF